VDYERTEEEQLAALKRWWSENGNALVIGIALALAVTFGWQAWQKQIQNAKYEASALYQQILDAATAGSPEDRVKNAATIRLVGEKLKADYESTEYAKFAAFFMAKTAIDSKDLDLAAQELRWILAHNPDEATRAVTNARLARILVEQGKLDEAMSLASTAVGSAFQPMYLEIQGDILLKQGNRDAARAAYEKAKNLLKTEDRNRILLELKLSDLADVEGV
jgi:predicted negative regulator of RcsB-dependent stress response